MLSHLDSVIFPDRCEVIEIIPSQRHVYPIFKNGYSSLWHYARINSCKILLNQQLKSLEHVDVVLRDPQKRFVSGINTFVQMTMKDHPDLDQDTVIWFAKNFLFLNRHYAPQFLWLLNLARFIDPQTKINFFNLSELDKLCGLNDKPEGILPATDRLVKSVENLPHNEMYLRIDSALIQCIGQQMKFAQVIDFLRTKDTSAFDAVVSHSQKIIQPTYALPQT